MTMRELVAAIANLPTVEAARLVDCRKGPILVVGVRVLPGVAWQDVVQAVRDDLSPKLPPGVRLELLELR